MRKLKFSKTFRNFLISYVIILVIPLITAIISYHTSIKIAESKSIDKSVSKQAKDLKALIQSLKVKYEN